MNQPTMAQDFMNEMNNMGPGPQQPSQFQYAQQTHFIDRPDMHNEDHDYFNKLRGNVPMAGPQMSPMRQAMGPPAPNTIYPQTSYLGDGAAADDNDYDSLDSDDMSIESDESDGPKITSKEIKKATKKAGKSGKSGKGGKKGSKAESENESDEEAPCSYFDMACSCLKSPLIIFVVFVMLTHPLTDRYLRRLVPVLNKQVLYLVLFKSVIMVLLYSLFNWLL